MTHEYTRQADKQAFRDTEIPSLTTGTLSSSRKAKKGHQVVPLEGHFLGVVLFF